MRTTASIYSIPAEVIQLIASNNDGNDARTLRLVSKEISNAVNPIALSTFTIDLRGQGKLDYVKERWIAYATKSVPATAHGYVHTLRIRDIRTIRAGFQAPPAGGSVLHYDEARGWTLIGNTKLRAGRLLAEMLLAMPNVRRVDWVVSHGCQINRYILKHLNSLEYLTGMHIQQSAKYHTNNPDSDFRKGSAIGRLQSLSLHITDNHVNTMHEWIQESVLQSPQLISVSVSNSIAYSTWHNPVHGCPLLHDLFPAPPTNTSVLPQIHHLSLTGTRNTFDPYVNSYLRNLRSIVLNRTKYSPPQEGSAGNNCLWKDLQRAEVFPERIEFSLIDLQDDFLDYLMAYPPNKFRSLKLDNRNWIYLYRARLNKLALRFYGEVLKAEHIRDSLEELVIISRDSGSKWCWDKAPGMVEAVRACQRLRADDIKIQPIEKEVSLNDQDDKSIY